MAANFSKSYKFLLLARVALFVTAVSFAAYGQGTAPNWIREEWRDSNYSNTDWYVGFSENALRNADVATSLRTLERDAINKMVENISVRISGTSTTEKTSTRISGGGVSGGGSSTDYRQTIESSASAEIANLERRSYHDRETGRIYAFAAVRRRDFAAHCVSRAEQCLQKAESALSEARLLPVGEKKSEASGRVTGNLDEGARYLGLLAAVDRESGELKPLLAREAELRKQLSIKEKVAIYVAGKESKGIQGLHRILGSELAKEVNASGYYSAVDRIGHRLDLPVDDRQISVLGKQLGVEYLCIAEVSPTRGGEYDLSARLVSAATAEERALATEHSTLEGAREMRLASEKLASMLMGNVARAKEAELELRKSEELAARVSDVKPVTEDSRPRQGELASRGREASEPEYGADWGYSSTPVDRPGFDRNKFLIDSINAAPDGSADGGQGGSAGGGQDGWPRYGARFAGAAVLGGARSGAGGGLPESKSAGMSVSAGLTVSFPVTGGISFNPELTFDARRMDLSVTPPEGGLYGENGAMEYALSLPLLVRAEVSHFYAEAGLAFGYSLRSGFNFAGAERAQIEMGGAAGAGLAFGRRASTRHYIGYRFEGNITDFDDNGYCRFYRHSLGYTILF